jgi:uncharacterized protein (TIGR02594 family)
MSNIAALVAGKPLRLGAQGDAVRALQLALASFGYSLKGTGFFGGATDTAVEDFQRLNGLDVDGIVGPETAAAIDGRKAPIAGPIIDQVERPLWLIEALKWVNTREGAGGDDNPAIIEWAREEGGEIAREFRHDAIPWCALFANMVLTKNNLKGTESLWALDFDSDTKWPNVKLSGPAVGAFAPMQRAGGGHIAIVIGRSRDGNLVCVGGNQSDKVSIAAFEPDRPRSFRFPLGVSLPALVGFRSLPIVNAAGVSISIQES